MVLFEDETGVLSSGLIFSLMNRFIVWITRRWEWESSKLFASQLRKQCQYFFDELRTNLPYGIQWTACFVHQCFIIISSTSRYSKKNRLQIDIVQRECLTFSNHDPSMLDNHRLTLSKQQYLEYEEKKVNSSFWIIVFFYLSFTERNFAILKMTVSTIWWMYSP